MHVLDNLCDVSINLNITARPGVDLLRYYFHATRKDPPHGESVIAPVT